jgi:adenosylhomocysteine nucleosidase
MPSHGRVRIVAITLLFVACTRPTLAQSTVGVLGALEAETAPIAKRLENSRDMVVHGHVFRVGEMRGHQVVLGRSGAGKVNAAIVTTLLIDRFSPSAIFFSGTAGAIDRALRPGDVVIGASVAQHDVGVRATDGLRRNGLRNPVTREPHPLFIVAPEMLMTAARRALGTPALPPVKSPDGQRTPRIVEGVIVTGDVFVTDAGVRNELRRSLAASAVEMEGGSVVQTCRQFDVSCLVVRSITDAADGGAPTSFQEFVAIASENAASVVAAIISELEAVTR